MRQTRFCSLLLAFSMILSMAVVFTFPATAEEAVESTAPATAPQVVPMSNPVVWSGEKAASFAGGTGTETDPYLIKTGEQLALIADYPSAWFELANDIYLNDPSLVKNWGKDSDFSTLEDKSNLKIWKSLPDFSGHVNGAGHMIFGMYCYSTTQNAGGSCALFKNLKSDSSIENLTIAYSTVDSNSDAAVLAQSKTGTVKNCHIVNCNVYSGAYNAGGFFASGNNVTSDSTFTGHLYSTSGSVAGIQVLASGTAAKTTIENCATYGTITSNQGKAAGLVCVTKNTSAHMHVYNSVNYATITGSKLSGGLLGETEAGLTAGATPAVIVNSINYGDVVAKSGMAGGAIAASRISHNKDAYRGGVIIYNFANYGHIKAQGEAGYAGGIIGSYGSSSSNQALVAYNCVIAGTVTAESGMAGQLIGKINTPFDSFYTDKAFSVKYAERVALKNIFHVGDALIGGTADNTANDYLSKINASGGMSLDGSTSSVAKLTDISNAIEKLNTLNNSKPKIFVWLKSGSNKVEFSYTPMDWEISASEIQAASLQLGDGIGINLYGEIDSLSFVGWSKVVVNGSEKLDIIDTVEKSGKNYLHYQHSVNPAEIGDTFTYTLNGKSIQYGVETYATRKYNNGSENLNQLLEAILQYGDAARVNAGKEAKSLAKINGTYSADAVSTAYGELTMAPAETNNEYITSASLNLNGRINLLMKVADGVAQVAVTYEYVDEAGEVCTANADTVDVVGDVAVFKGIAATALNLTYHLTALDANGAELGTTDWNVSQFITTGINTVFNDNQVAMAQALALYMQAARVYTGLDS